MAATVSVLLDGTDTTCRLNTEGLGVDVHPSGRFGLCRSLDTQTQGANIKVRSKTASTRWMRETTAAHGSCCPGVTLRCGHGELTDSYCSRPMVQASFRLAARIPTQKPRRRSVDNAHTRRCNCPSSWLLQAEMEHHVTVFLTRHQMGEQSCHLPPPLLCVSAESCEHARFSVVVWRGNMRQQHALTRQKRPATN